eukprot:jgi/Galph1/414/GphlegSOOS_G5278.1
MPSRHFNNTSGNNTALDESDEESEPQLLETKQVSVAEAEYEVAGEGDDLSDLDEDAMSPTRDHVANAADATFIEGAERQPSFSLADDTEVGPVTAFNLNEELDEGYLDKEGNFVDYYFENRIQGLENLVSSSDEEPSVSTKKRRPVRRSRPEADSWLDSLQQVKPVYDSGSTSHGIRKRSREEEEEEFSNSEDRVKELYAKLARLLREGESILQILRRLGQKKNDPVCKREFEEVTELADALINRGEYNIYEETREHCLKKAGLGKFGRETEKELSEEHHKRARKGVMLEESVEQTTGNNSKRWELMWSHEPAKVYGPFSNTTDQRLV